MKKLSELKALAADALNQAAEFIQEKKDDGTVDEAKATALALAAAAKAKIQSLGK
jgi:hypothetical protein